MLYLDDMAVWLHTQKGSILRGCLCGAVVLASAVTGFMTWSGRDAQAAEIKKNEVTIAECRYQLDAINQKINGFDANEDLVYYSPRAVAEPIATLQSRYGGYIENTSVDTIRADSEAVRNELADYIEASASESPWFPNFATSYEWVYPMREESIVQTVPVVFECRDTKSGSLLGVVTGVYDGSEERCGSFTVYQTLDGYYEINGQEDGGGEALESEVDEIMGTVSGNSLTGDTESDNAAIVDGIANPELETNEEDDLSEDPGAVDMGGSKVTKKMDNDEILSSVLKGEGQTDGASSGSKSSKSRASNEAQKGVGSDE